VYTSTLKSWLSTKPEDYEAIREKAFPQEQRRPVGPVGFLITLACVGLALFTLWQALVAPIPAIRLRATHLAVVIPLDSRIYGLRCICLGNR
jgi:TRAP-type uncharacterized transport system fused permease subunit